ncbi:hypothetical protein BKI52_28290 [marine bacterium AO1-C]|nr:hypothetical protein BKI52_28290 [marine bacterium AO1-C]
MKQVTGLYKKVAWGMLILGAWIVIGYCIRIIRPHPHNSLMQLLLNMTLLGVTPIILAILMFRNLKKEQKK